MNSVWTIPIRRSLWKLFSAVILTIGFLMMGAGAAEAQVPQKVITTNADGARSVYAADLTGSGTLDVLSASRTDDKIAWYENNGDGTFSTQKVISTDADDAVSVFAVDLTGNGQTDVLSGSDADFDTVAWYENNGDGTFSSRKVISDFDAESAVSIFAADLSGDGDPDVLFGSGASFNGKIAWYENNGDGTFSDQKVITTDADIAQSVYAADLTGDGDKDVLSASRGDNKIAWYENNGDGTFSDQKVISTEPLDPLSVYAADLTGNGDLDVLSGDEGLGEVAWYENNGDGTFSDQKVISSGSTVESVFAADLNGDGQLDVLSADSPDDEIAWHENNGDGTFSFRKVITTDADGAQSVYAADLTDEGDKDVLSASSQDNKIAWYENTEGVLPVELSGLSARADGTGATVSWKTAAETNNAGFYVQHQAPSPNSSSPTESASKEPEWERLGFVEGAGTTTEAMSYRFAVEKDLKPGMHQFRLRQVDTDGTAHLSEAVSLRVQMEEKARLSAPAPNPTGEEARLTFSVRETEETTVRLFDVLGQQVKTLFRGQPAAGEPVQLSLDASGLASGTYFVRMRAGSFETTRRLTVVR